MEFVGNLSEAGRAQRDKQRSKLLKELETLSELRNRPVGDTRSWAEKRYEESVNGWQRKLETNALRRAEAIRSAIEIVTARINREYDQQEENARRHLEESTVKLEAERAKEKPVDASVAAQERKIRVLLKEYDRVGFLSPEDAVRFQEFLPAQLTTSNTAPVLEAPPLKPFRIEEWETPEERELSKMREEAQAEIRRSQREREEAAARKRQEDLRQYEMSKRDQERLEEQQQREKRQRELEVRAAAEGQPLSTEKPLVDWDAPENLPSRYIEKERNREKNLHEDTESEGSAEESEEDEEQLLREIEEAKKRQPWRIPSNTSAPRIRRLSNSPAPVPPPEGSIPGVQVLRQKPFGGLPAVDTKQVIVPPPPPPAKKPPKSVQKRPAFKEVGPGVSCYKAPEE